jgi:hypothetical protein
VTAEQWTRLKAVFADAIEQPSDRRRAWLVDACGDDNDLARQVAALVDAYEQDATFLERSAEFDPSDVAVALGLSKPAPEAALPPGTILGDGRYQILGEIGRGGMGIVYVAQDLRLPRRVALKSLPSDARESPVRLERLRREAWAAARVAHPAIATVYAFEELGGEPFIVSEYVRGRTLRSELGTGAVEPRRAVAIAADIARALAAAHDQGVVHRDLKPENVLLTDDGGLKVVDFGVAQLALDDVPGLTQTGTWLGTPAYMAPEQSEAGGVDGRADIYSLGIVLAEMLTGRHPLRPPSSAGDSAAARPASRPEAPGGSIPGPLGAIVKRCVQLLPSERYGSARELLHDLERLTAGGAPAQPARSSALWWWSFHQVAAAAAYIAMAVVAWQALDAIGRVGAAVHGFFAVALLASVIVSVNLRLNLWFTARFFPNQLDRVRRQRRLWIVAADLVFSASLVGAGALLLVLLRERALSLVLLALGIGAAAALTLIEPVTARAAFHETEDSSTEL